MQNSTYITAATVKTHRWVNGALLHSPVEGQVYKTYGCAEPTCSRSLE